MKASRSQPFTETELWFELDDALGAIVGAGIELWTDNSPWLSGWRATRSTGLDPIGYSAEQERPHAEFKKAHGMYPFGQARTVPLAFGLAGPFRVSPDGPVPTRVDVELDVHTPEPLRDRDRLNVVVFTGLGPHDQVAKADAKCGRRKREQGESFVDGRLCDIGY
ncbi:MAG: hypothetical protein ABSD85_00455 [Acidimicrobiales bacterium]